MAGDEISSPATAGSGCQPDTAIMGGVRIGVRVYPNAKRTRVGGRYGDSEPPVLVVRVQAPAVEGKANDAVIAALADAFGVPKRAVRILSGHASRAKTVDLDGVTDGDVQRLLGAVD